jgi:hypothetical protein
VAGSLPPRYDPDFTYINLQEAGMNFLCNAQNPEKKLGVMVIDPNLAAFFGSLGKPDTAAHQFSE